MEFLKFNKEFAQSDITNRLRIQALVKKSVAKEYNAVKDHRQKKSVLFKVKARLQNKGRHRMRWKIKRMRRDRTFPQMPGKRDKYRQYGFIPKINVQPSATQSPSSSK